MRLSIVMPITIKPRFENTWDIVDLNIESKCTNLIHQHFNTQ